MSAPGSFTIIQTHISQNHSRGHGPIWNLLRKSYGNISACLNIPYFTHFFVLVIWRHKLLEHGHVMQNIVLPFFIDFSTIHQF